MKFKFESGEEVDVLKHAGEIFSKYELDTSPKIYVGCDSQNRRYNTAYVTVVAFRYGHKGCHFVYQREGVKKIKDRWNRLWGEVTRSVDTAIALRNAGFEVHCIDLDFNKKEIARSSEMVATAKGFVIGQGFNCTCKPEEQCASRAADHMVRQ